MVPSGRTAYFNDESDALRAAEDLRDRGVQSELRNGERANGSALIITYTDDTAMLEEVVTRYNGRLPGRTSTPPATTADYAASPSQLSGESEPRGGD